MSSRHLSTAWCNDCESIVQIEIIASPQRRTEGEPPFTMRLCTCVRCNAAIVLETIEVGPDDWAVEQVFPRPLRKRPRDLPARVAESYEEALRCFGANAHLATAVMVRRTLEAIAREHDSSVKAPAQGLRVLFERGLITQEMSEWGHQLRFLGNIGAHPTGDHVGAADARDSLDFLEAIIEVMYRLRPKFQQLVARRNAPTAG